MCSCLLAEFDETEHIYETHLTDDVRSIRRDNERTDCGKLDLLAADASFVDRPSYNPSCRQGCKLH